MNDHELDLALADMGAPHVQVRVPLTLRERVRAVPLQTPRPRSWLPQSPKWRFQSTFSATKLIVASAIVALFGGFLLSGVLTQHPSDERLPAVGASASASTQAEPTGAATTEPEQTTDPDGTTTTDLLPGVDLATEEVEPGVFRVLDDEYREFDERDAVHATDSIIVAGLDGSVWIFDQLGFGQLGVPGTHRWPEGQRFRNWIPRRDIEVGPDGTIWVAYTWHHESDRTVLAGGIASHDGEAWTIQRSGGGRDDYLGVEVQQDGTVWGAWSTERARPEHPVTVARLVDGEWESLPGNLRTGAALGEGELVLPAHGGSSAWITTVDGDLHRHDGEGWLVEPVPPMSRRPAVGSDGTVWVKVCGLAERCGMVYHGLARYEDGEWDTFDSSDGIPPIGWDVSQGRAPHVFEVDPRGRIWFDARGDAPGVNPCDGIAHFDGEAVAYHLRDTCIQSFDLAPDGTAWLRAESDGSTHTYVITPEAVAATGSRGGSGEREVRVSSE